MKKIVIEAVIHLFVIFLMAYSVHAQQGTDISFLKEEHRVLSQFAGQWRQLYEHNPVGSKTPGFGKGESLNRIQYKGVFIEMNGRLFYSGGTILSKTIIGYDSNLKKYFFLSYDSVGMLPLLCQGEYSLETNSFTFLGEKYYTTDAASKVRIEIYFERPDKYFLEIYRTEDNKEVKILSVANIKIAE